VTESAPIPGSTPDTEKLTRPDVVAYAIALSVAVAAGTMEGYALPWIALSAIGIATLIAFWKKPFGLDRTILIYGAGLIGFAAWCALSALWAVSPTAALIQAGIASGLALAALIGHSHAWRFSPSHIAVACRGTVIGLTIALIYYVFEVSTGLSIRKAIDLHLLARPDRYYHVYMRAEAWRMNRGVATFVMLFWPAALMITVMNRRRGMAWLFAALVAYCVFMLNHKTSMVALACSGVVYFWSRAHFASARRVVMGLWVAGCLLVVPMIHVIGQTNFRAMDWLTPTVQARLALWSTIVNDMKQPLVGVGAGNHQNAAMAPPFERSDDVASGKGRYDHHPHNVYLQIWHELGVVGALLLATIGMSLLRALNAGPVDRRPFLLAAFAVVAIQMATTFSIWQTWFATAIGLTTIVCANAARCDPKRLWAYLDETETIASSAASASGSTLSDNENMRRAEALGKHAVEPAE
jgi:exopolysaccharide production protein ExoQ